MRKTILADDDHLVRCYLKTLPSWEKAGFSLEAEARDGEEALEIFRKSGADLVVTDISMPLMDGIELIRKLRREDEQVYIIVLSCHGDVEYVKEAMKQGADEYILKNTLDEDSLYELLTAAAKRIDERQRELISEGTHEMKGSAAAGFFKKVLAGSLTGAQREKERLKAGINGLYESCGTVSMKLASWEASDESILMLQQDQYCADFQERINAAIDDADDIEVKEVHAVYLGNGVLCCFADMSGMCRSSEIQKYMMRTASVCKAMCMKEKYSFMISVSSICSGERCITDSYHQAMEAMQEGFYSNDRIVYYESKHRFSDRLPEEAEQVISRADVYRYRHDKEKLMALCRSAGYVMERENTSPEIVIKWMKDLVRAMGADGSLHYNRPQTMQQVYEIIEAEAENLARGKKTMIPENAGKAVKIAAEYAANHYKEPIGLSDAAEAAGVSSAYMSYLFAQEMGMGFSNFLLEQRMECARQLLRETNLKVKEVAARAGFNDYHYFSKAFKKINGMSPAEYRKS